MVGNIPLVYEKSGVLESAVPYRVEKRRPSPSSILVDALLPIRKIFAENPTEGTFKLQCQNRDSAAPTLALEYSVEN